MDQIHRIGNLSNEMLLSQQHYRSMVLL